MNTLKRIWALCALVVVAGCVGVEPSRPAEICRASIPLPEPVIFYPVEYDVETGERIGESTPLKVEGKFKDMRVSPRLARCGQPGRYWIPGTIYEASDELEKMLPHEYYERFLKLFGASGWNPPDDMDVGMTVSALDTLLADIWELHGSRTSGETRFQRTVECLGTEGYDIEIFYRLMADLEARKHGVDYLASTGDPFVGELQEFYQFKLQDCHVKLD